MLRRIAHISTLTILVLFGLALGAILAFWTTDIERATLERYYAPPPSQFVATASGARIHYRDQGSRDGIALVLLHGTGASLHTWEPWVERLSPLYRIVTLDLPAHGLTGATPDGDYGRAGMIGAIDAVVTNVGLPRFVIGGNSMGGEMAMAYALAYPERIRGLILVDAAGLGRHGGGGAGDGERSAPLAFQLARFPGFGRIVSKVTPRPLISEGLHSVYADDSKIDSLLVDRYWHLLRLEGSRRAMLARFAAAGESEPLEIEKLSMPALVLWGDQDRLIPPAVGDMLAERLPDATLVRYAEAGHLPMEEIPEQSAADVRRFLSDLREQEVAAARH